MEARPRGLKHWADRCGLGRRPAETTLWVCNDDEKHIEAASRLLNAVQVTYPRVQLLFTSTVKANRRRLAAQYPNAVVRVPPLNLPPFPSWFLTRLRVQAVLFLMSADGMGRSVKAAIRRHRVPAMVVETGRMMGRPAPGGDMLRAGLDELAVILRSDPKERRDDGGGPIASGMRKLWQFRLGRRVLEWRAKRFDDFASLKAELGDPEAILCLGNGPSSEDPRLQHTQYDCVFRVNWEWKQRNFLTDVDMVFTGNARTIREVPAAIFGFQKVATEKDVLMHTLVPRFRSRLRYLTLERLPSFFNEEDWGAKATNGSAMLAVAVALKPRRIIIAGIDLYADPAGGYPGAPQRANAYHPAHDRRTELRILERALSEFDGEIVILSDVLRTYLDAQLRKPEPRN
jgi:3-deoxy-D-manno-octulosonic-acid transferase-like protein